MGNAVKCDEKIRSVPTPNPDVRPAFRPAYRPGPVPLARYGDPAHRRPLRAGIPGISGSGVSPVKTLISSLEFVERAGALIYTVVCM